MSNPKRQLNAAFESDRLRRRSTRTKRSPSLHRLTLMLEIAASRTPAPRTRTPAMIIEHDNGTTAAAATSSATAAAYNSIARAAVVPSSPP
ncbi:hypothetical protein ACCO45_004579 [Purpureocillium lilacinum]|uniref:Uncharacterized protein n=1 Tax=Purpureocillium lilacinum TaxID=33203 RepID=A0ACC4DU69_PURLI